MRSQTFAALLLVLTTPLCPAEDAAEFLARAAKATAGSVEAVAKRKYCIMKQSGVVYLPAPAGAAPASREVTLAPPDRMKCDLQLRTTAGPASFLIVLNGLSGWSKQNKDVTQLSPTQYDSVQNEVYTLWLASLAPMRSRSISWELLPDAAVEGRPARVVKATQGNRPTVTLYFDRDSLLLAKATYAGMENLRMQSKEYMFASHKDFDGQKLPSKVQVSQSNKRIEEWTIESYRFPAQIDDREFSKPK